MTPESSPQVALPKSHKSMQVNQTLQKCLLKLPTSYCRWYSNWYTWKLNRV